MSNGNLLERRARGCSMGILILRNVRNTPNEDALKEAKRGLESAIREAYGGKTRKELAGIHPMDAYVSYYKKFGYSYHVLGQFESVLQGKPLPGGNPLVGAMFLSELKNMLLTAGHDFGQIALPLFLDSASGSEEYASLGGRSATAVAGDFMLSDSEGALSSILRGPAQRACITERTNSVLYTVYAPQGVEPELVAQHLNDIEAYIRIFSADSLTQAKEVYQG